jgi:trans-2,3-dihydro-3-hydroxyanthranilate isomerase
MTAYLVYDVFTDTAFGGNPLAVIPDATGSTRALLQKIAREFNFSETTFVYPPEDPAHTARVRIFTPTQEVPFAGHPTSGPRWRWPNSGRSGEMVLELGVGPIACTVTGAARFRTTRPLERLHTPEVATVARPAWALPRATSAPIAAPPVMASVGLPFVFAESRPLALARCARHRRLPRAGALYPSSFDFAVAVYVRTKARCGCACSRRSTTSPKTRPREAPRRRSAHCWRTRTARLTLDIAQGVEMGRPSRILVEAPGASVGVAVAGSARRSWRGGSPLGLQRTAPIVYSEATKAERAHERNRSSPVPRPRACA